MKGYNEHFFDDSTEKVLYIIANKVVNNGMSELNQNEISQLYNERFNVLENKIDVVLENLIKNSFIIEKNNSYILTDLGENKFNDIVLKYHDHSFSEVMVTEDGSKAFRYVANKLHGQYLGQVNMTDQEQLDKVVGLIQERKNKTILDLGCGLGYISSFIQEKTGTKVIGLDNASGALKLAEERNKRNNKLKFVHGDINDPEFPEQSLDYIIAIDSLYFVRDLYKTLRNLKRLLKPDGKMLIFFSQYGFGNEPESLFTPYGTQLAQNLQKLALKYKYYDFTENERKHWNKKLQMLEENKEDFLKEQNEKLFNVYFNEAMGTIENFKTHPFKRYLYEIIL